MNAVVDILFLYNILGDEVLRPVKVNFSYQSVFLQGLVDVHDHGFELVNFHTRHPLTERAASFRLITAITSQ